MAELVIQGRSYPFPEDLTLGELHRADQQGVNLLDSRFLEAPSASTIIALIEIVKRRAGEKFDPSVIEDLNISEVEIKGDDADPPPMNRAARRAAKSSGSATTRDTSGNPG